MTGTYEERLQAFAGRELIATRPGQDPVNQPMIRHWAEAMGDTRPVLVDADAARAAGREGVVAPASMVQAWTMRGYAAHTARVADPAGAGGAGDAGNTGDAGGAGDVDGTAASGGSGGAFDELVGLLAEGGYTSVVATDSELEFHRELVPGDHVSVREVVESISPEKTTALGAGRFVSTVRTYSDQEGETVAVQRWRTLRFRPKERPGTPPARPEEQPRKGALRPRPAINKDNAFWFEAAKRHRLVVQRCTSCETLRHPPGPCCPECGSFEWDAAEVCGGGRVHTYAVNHHPRHPAFEYPLIVAVVELEEGTRLITNLVGAAPEDVEIGMPVVLGWLDADPDLTLPVFRPAERDEH